MKGCGRVLATLTALLLFVSSLAAQSAGEERVDPSAEELFEIGNTAFREGRYPAAILAYRRALQRTGPVDALEFNLEEAERRLGLIDPDVDAWTHFLARADAGEVRTPDLVAMLVLEVLALGLLVFGRKRRWRLLGLLLGLLFAVILFRVGEGLERGRSPTAIILEERSGLRARPHVQELPFLGVPAGARVRVERRSEHWYLVRYGDARGFISADRLGLID